MSPLFPLLPLIGCVVGQLLRSAGPTPGCVGRSVVATALRVVIGADVTAACLVVVVGKVVVLAVVEVVEALAVVEVLVEAGAVTTAEALDGGDPARAFRPSPPPHAESITIINTSTTGRIALPPSYLNVPPRSGRLRPSNDNPGELPQPLASCSFSLDASAGCHSSLS